MLCLVEIRWLISSLKKLFLMIHKVSSSWHFFRGRNVLSLIQARLGLDDWGCILYFHPPIILVKVYCSFFRPEEFFRSAQALLDVRHVWSDLLVLWCFAVLQTLCIYTYEGVSWLETLTTIILWSCTLAVFRGLPGI